MDRVTVLHSAHGAANAIMALGIAEGCFEAQGIDLLMREVPRNGQAVAGLVAGESTFAVAAALPLMNAARAGGDPRVVMSLEAENVFGIIGARGITDPGALRGRTVAISGAREMDDMMMRRALAEWGLGTGDLQFLVTGSRGNCWAAVTSGQAAAMAATVPQPIRARMAGLPVLKDYSDRSEPFQLGALLTTRRLAAGRPDLVMRVMRGQLAATRMFAADFNRALPHLMARSKFNEVEVHRHTHRIFSHSALDFVPKVEALAAVIALFERVFGEDSGLAAADLVEADFARRLAAEM